MEGRMPFVTVAAWAETGTDTGRESDLKFSVALSDKLPNKQIGNQQKANNKRSKEVGGGSGE